MGSWLNYSACYCAFNLTAESGSNNNVYQNKSLRERGRVGGWMEGVTTTSSPANCSQGVISSRLASVLNITLHVPFSFRKHFHKYIDAAAEKACVRSALPPPLCSSIMMGYSYLRWSSLAEKSPLCLARYWILALGPAPSVEAERGHIGSWLPQLSFSLINDKTKFPDNQRCRSWINIFPNETKIL